MRINWLSVSVLLFLLGTRPLALVHAQELTDPLIQIGSPGNLYSEILDEERKFWIHLPESYSASVDITYPVIYLLDGEQLLGGLAAIQQFYSFFRIPEMIVVGISNDTNRTRDLTPTVVASRHDSEVEASGGAPEFRAFLTKELIPHIDSTYSTSAHRVLIGHSFAGLFAIDTLVGQADLFTHYVALDPSLDWDDGKWLKQALEKLDSAQLAGHSLFLAISNEIIRFSDTLTFETVDSDSSRFSLGVRSAKKFVEVQEKLHNDLSFASKFYDQDIHGSIPLVGMRDGLVDIYDFWELKRPSLYNDPDTPTETILSLIRDQSQAREEGMGYPLPMELDLLEMLGQFYADVGQTTKAKGVLALASTYYPLVSSLHGTLVDLCAELKDETCAREHAIIADSLSGASTYQDKVDSVFGDSN
ncbi:MAG: alpha/beta hydrolase-fold protein [Rhodothermales bacterium]|nr:alpha/beta hydrolase-fold protein [Rhodothermales bacterium]MDG2015477.1 alpha/beta hydrolase-fold protein [Rhodothermales bacterium]HAY36349.1 esterase [Bacteroidota bacterium]